MHRLFILLFSLIAPAFIYSQSILNYTLKQDDTLLELCELFNVSERELSRHNKPATVERFWAGATLRIPLKGISLRKYRIKKGDSVFLLVKRFKINPELLYKINSKNTLKRMWAGDKIILPLPNKKQTPSKSKKPEVKKTPPGSNRMLYKIRRGDSFFSLSKKFRVPVRTLKTIYPRKTLYAGTSILIPKSSAPKISFFSLKAPLHKHQPELKKLSVPGLHYLARSSRGVRSPIEGKVIGIRKLKGFGKTIFIRKKNMTVLLASKGFQNILVSYGYLLKQEQIAATIRSGYYLHFFTLKDHVFVSPKQYLR